MRRALHTDAEGKPALGQDLRYHRGAAGRPSEVQGGLQRALADPATWLPLTKPVQTRRNGQNPGRRVSFISVSITLGRYKRVSTAFAESTVNTVVGKRFAKRQQMRWSKRGAHFMLQTRARVLDSTLRSKFEQWYPGLAVATSDQKPEAVPMAA